MICAAGGVWRRTDATAATSSSQRRCVYAQMTTEIDGPGDVGGWPVANLSALPLGPAWSWQRPASQRPVVGAAAEDVGDQRPPVVQRLRQTRQGLVPDAAEECEVQGSPVGQEPGPLDEVVAVEERRDELVDLGGVHAAVGVDHHDDVPARGREAGP